MAHGTFHARFQAGVDLTDTGFINESPNVLRVNSATGHDDDLFPGNIDELS